MPCKLCYWPRKFIRQPDQISKKLIDNICLSAIEREVPLRDTKPTWSRAGTPRRSPHRDLTICATSAAYVEDSGEANTHIRTASRPSTKPFLRCRSTRSTNGQFALFVIGRGGLRKHCRHLWSKEGWEWKEKNYIVEPELLARRKWQCTESAGRWRIVLRSRSLLQVGRRVLAQRATVGGGRARPGGT